MSAHGNNPPQAMEVKLFMGFTGERLD